MAGHHDDDGQTQCREAGRIDQNAGAGGESGGEVLGDPHGGQRGPEEQAHGVGIGAEVHPAAVIGIGVAAQQGQHDHDQG